MEVERGIYRFIGEKADQSARYYDIAVSRMTGQDHDYAAWEAAHKFGTRMVGNKIASYKEGLVFGEDALIAAEFIDTERDNYYKTLPELNRGRKIKEKMLALVSEAEKRFDVTIKRL